jgi:CheY-like chemotaxis protein
MWYPWKKAKRELTAAMSKILIVDDDPHIRELARVFLKNEGYDTDEASDGVEALSKLETTKIDLVVLDIMMPNMDGWELCRQLKELYDFPVLMLTARGETSQKLKGFELGEVHEGTIDLESKPGEGTIFTISLPMEQIRRISS